MASNRCHDPLMVDASGSDNIVIFRSPLSEFMGFVWVLVLTILSVYLTVQFPWSLQYIPLGSLFGLNLAFPLPLFAILPIVMLARTLHNLYNYRYILCDSYLLEVQGILAFARKSVRVNYVHIRGIEIDESFINRILGLGNLVILGVIGEQGKPSLQIDGVAKPRHVKDLIQARVDATINGLKVQQLS